MREPTRSVLADYTIAPLCSIGALLLTLGLWPLFRSTPVVLLLAAVAVSAWYGGLGPGLLATLLTAVAGALPHRLAGGQRAQ